MKKTILVAMSGGVDSSVAAAILKKKGHNVIGLTMQIWQESQTDARHAGCCSLGAVEDARRVARTLDIPHYVVNLKEDFKRAVIDNFVSQYAVGRTPNPCVECNRQIKFETLFQKMKEFGCDQLATGHYARIRKDHQNNVFRLLKARAPEKDQSYVLYMLGQRHLGSVKFPMGELPSKEFAREMARSLGLHLAEKPDSQEICFVSEAGGYREFLRNANPKGFTPGELVLSSGEVIGDHGGVADFTVGQRRGLGVAKGKPLYVLQLQPLTNRVVVGTEDELDSDTANLDPLSWPSGVPSAEPIKVMAKIRYNNAPYAATLFSGNAPFLKFDRPVKAVTPGQVAVCYQGKTVVAGGTISSNQK